MGLRRQLHSLSRQLFNIALNRGIGPTGSDLDQTYADLLEHLLFYSALSIEILAMYRVSRGINCLKLPITVPPSCESIRISSGGYERTYELSELTATLAACPKELANDVTQEATELSLSQMMLPILLSFDTRIEGDHLFVRDNGSMPTAVFSSLAHACLVRIPRIEEDLQLLATVILEALRNNDEIVLPVFSSNLREDLLILAHDFARVRKCLRVKRCFGVANGKEYFPPDVMCRSLLHRTITAKEFTLPGSPLTSNLPASKYRCSWDLRAGSVVNLIVPNYGLNAFLSDLKTGKFCGVKLTYLYSGKMMLVYDLLIAVVSFGLLALCEYGHLVLKNQAILGALLSAGSKIWTAIIYGSLVKVVFWDIGNWVPRWRFWIKSLRAASDTEADNSK